MENADLKMKQKRIIILVLLLVGGFFFFRWQNDGLVVSEIVVENTNIPDSFHDYKIVQISDLHSKEFGAHQEKILGKIKKLTPDLIVVTGDLIDSKNVDIEKAMDLMHGAMAIAPVYYVSGNHEAWSGVYEDLKSRLEGEGVVVLDNQKVELTHDDQSIELMGLLDPAFMNSDEIQNDSNESTEDVLRTLTNETNQFTILLSHRPELFEVYSDNNIDLVFAGHAHGGQFRLPLIGGLVAPDQGFFPKLTTGIQVKNQTSLVISRGLGNSIIPIRIFNRPELIVVTLKN